MEPLVDPEGDRAIKDIVPPPHRPLADDLLYPNKCKTKTANSTYFRI